jgi:hypothetical protein
VLSAGVCKRTLNDLQKKATGACMDSSDRHRRGNLFLYFGAIKTVLALYLANAAFSATRCVRLLSRVHEFLCGVWVEGRDVQIRSRARLPGGSGRCTRWRVLELCWRRGAGSFLAGMDLPY